MNPYEKGVFMPENKAVSFKLEGGKFVIAVDLNKDGQPMIQIAVDLAEVPDEVLAIFKK
jgi:hypothetical protein